MTAPLETVPHNSEAEQAVLGAILLNGGGLQQCLARGGTDLFCDPLHAAIFSAILTKFRLGELVDPLTVSEAMRSNPGVNHLPIGEYLVRVSGAAAASATVGGYVAMLADLRSKRALQKAFLGALREIADGTLPAHTIAAGVELTMIAAADTHVAAGPVPQQKAVATAMIQIHAAYCGDDGSLVRTGIRDLDRLVGGFHPGELALLGGRPSMGKTGVATSLTLNVARGGAGVCIASLEMAPEALAMRMLSEATARGSDPTPYASLRRGDMNEQQLDLLKAAAVQVGQLPIAYLSQASDTVGALLAGARQIQRSMNGNMRLMIVDYAQLLRSPAANRYEQITDISIALKNMAVQLNVPVLALSQLSRNLEQREDKRPVLSDLRESGQLEQDADVVLFCFRESHYHERDKPRPGAQVADRADWEAAARVIRNRLEIIVAKQRQGEIGTAHVFFDPAVNLLLDDANEH